jgi:pimeloyl-ACP methyl ester carboxylesterase
MRVRALIGATFVAWAFLPALALVASADEDPPLLPVDAGPPLRPPLTVLRVVATVPPTLAITADKPKKELIVLVGGYGTGPDSHVFDAFRARVAQESIYEVVRFGHDLGSYDTFGGVDTNADQLRDSIRSVSGGYDGVHIVTHSMGGVVADRAFARGLSVSDGVTTYVAWASPHDGSRAAQAMQATLALSGPGRDDTRAFTTAYFRDPDSDAVRDLARARAVAPPSGVVRLDLRLATDTLVMGADARDPGVPSRVLLPTSIGELEGHGGILQSEQALDLTLATIKTRSVPPDRRGRVLLAASDVVAQTVDGYAHVVLGGICTLCLIGGVGGLLRRTFRRVVPWPPISE